MQYLKNRRLIITTTYIKLGGGDDNKECKRKARLACSLALSLSLSLSFCNVLQWLLSLLSPPPVYLYGGGYYSESTK